MSQAPFGVRRPFLHAIRIAVAVLFWPALALVVWGELTPHLDEPVETPDKLLHFIAYFGLAGMAACALRRRRAVLLAVLILIAVGGLLEILQGFTGRDPDIYDELTNGAGALTGGLLARLIVEPLRRRFADGRGRD